ncbi:hypothetical protein IWQ60_002944 [Tieghemiomyces parasiticus]|uniref:Uncharacterized protein n=1 Tax=Tieghemiomyces parasiticus TaxID=78921 RepID=A0A9W8E0N4_9FUNG|nr:hypothetical protein IWQ60_002944 [Tieghemiomyces parasiticus]
MKDGPLDMRMASYGRHETSEQAIRERTGRRTVPASVVVNNYTVEQLADIFTTYGEERHAYRIAQAIDQYRRQQVIATTAQLAEVIYSAVPHAQRQRSADGRSFRNPASRVFQGLRIYVNDELAELQMSLGEAFSLTRPGGRVVVVSFHSLEDRIVKRLFREQSQAEETTDDPVTPAFRLLTRKVIKPTKEEMAGNPRARSALLRAIERT